MDIVRYGMDVGMDGRHGAVRIAAAVVKKGNGFRSFPFMFMVNVRGYVPLRGFVLFRDFVSLRGCTSLRSCLRLLRATVSQASCRLAALLLRPIFAPSPLAPS